MTFYERNYETPRTQDFDTVLFDMDGTLLDLHFDNEFWLKSLVNDYASARGIRACDAKTQLQKKMKRNEFKFTRSHDLPATKKTAIKRRIYSSRCCTLQLNFQ